MVYISLSTNATSSMREYFFSEYYGHNKGFMDTANSQIDYYKLKNRQKILEVRSNGDVDVDLELQKILMITDANSKISYYGSFETEYSDLNYDVLVAKITDLTTKRDAIIVDLDSGVAAYYASNSYNLIMY